MPIRIHFPKVMWIYAELRIRIRNPPLNPVGELFAGFAELLYGIFQILRAAAAAGPQAHEEGEHCPRGHQA